MKVFLSLSLIFTLASCVSIQEWEGGYQTKGFDFRPYTNEGFLFTPNKYEGDFEAIGMIEVIAKPKIEKTPPNQKNMEGASRVLYGQDYYFVHDPNPSKLVEQLYKRAKEMGADAITQFQISEHSISNNGFEVPTIRAYGFAIKRK